MVMEFRIYRGCFYIPDEGEFLAEIRDIAESSSLFIVFFDRDAIAGCDHIQAALSLAERSFFEYKNPISNFFEMEVLLYAVGTRQTGFASRFGIHRGMNDSVILICSRKFQEETQDLFEERAGEASSKIASLENCTGKNIDMMREEDCIKFSGNRAAKRISRLVEIFSITQKEIEICGDSRIEELIIERCALLDVNR